MAKRFNFDDAITTDIKGAASDSYIDNIRNSCNAQQIRSKKL